MNTRSMRLAAVLVVVCGMLVMVAGCGNRSAQSSGVSPLQNTQAESVAPPLTSSGAQGGAALDKSSTSASPAEPARMVVAAASMHVQVDQLEKSVEQLRAITAGAGGTVSQLSYTQGDGGSPITPQVEGSSAAAQPSTALLTLRVPAAKLPEVEKKVRGMGNVLSQTAEETDVTQQHLDLAARIANLQAEEVRLRAMLDKAKNVSEMLAVERELARVQGDIESMQAQLTYLERQAAQATLSVTLSEPGALVRPASGGWGLGSAVTSGFQGAAIFLRAMIASLIALSPLILFGVLIWLVIRTIRRRRKVKKEPVAQEPIE